MNRRQQKKFYVGSFQNLIFSVWGSLYERYRTPQHQEKLTEELLDFIFRHNICTAGSYSENSFSFVFDHSKRPPHNITPAQRQMIVDWFAARKDIQHLRAGSLLDGFYCTEAQYCRYDEVCR